MLLQTNTQYFQRKGRALKLMKYRSYNQIKELEAHRTERREIQSITSTPKHTSYIVLKEQTIIIRIKQERRKSRDTNRHEYDLVGVRICLELQGRQDPETWDQGWGQPWAQQRAPIPLSRQQTNKTRIHSTWRPDAPSPSASCRIAGPLSSSRFMQIENWN